MATTPTPAPPTSAISLTTVGTEITFLASYVTDLLNVRTAPAADKLRVSALLAAAVADLNTAVAHVTAALHLGQSPIVGD